MGGFWEELRSAQGLVIALATALVTLVLVFIDARVRKMIEAKAERSAVHDLSNAFQAQMVEMGRRLDIGEDRLTKLETALPHLPDREDIQRLSIALTEMRGDLKAIHATMDGQARALGGLQRQVERIEEYIQAAPGRAA